MRVCVCVCVRVCVYLYVYMCMCEGVCMCVCPQRPEGVGSPGTGATAVLCPMGAEN